jgi:hypothetical protein
MRKSLWVVGLLVSGMLALSACKKDGDAEKTPDDKEPTKTEVANKAPAKTAVPVAAPTAASTAIPRPEPVPMTDVSGHYSASSGDLEIIQISSQLSRFSIKMSGEGRCAAQISGMLSLQDNNLGMYEEQGCMLKFAFNEGVIQVTEEGVSCNSYHDNTCSFSDMYRVNAAQDATSSDLPTGHYMHKYVSVDGSQCHGWELWLTKPNAVLDVKVALYDGACVASTVAGNNVLYDPRTSALSFDIATAKGTRSFSGTFNEASDLQGHVSE